MDKEKEINYVYSLLSFKDRIWLQFHHKERFIDELLGYIKEPSSNYALNSFVFNFVEDNKYPEALEQYYETYQQYREMSEKEKLTELIKGIKSIYRNCDLFLSSDSIIPDKFKPFISVHDYIVEKFPIPMSMKDEFVYFLFQYLKKNLFLLQRTEKVHPWIIISNRNNKYYKNKDELIELSKNDIDKIYEELKEKYSY